MDSQEATTHRVPPAQRFAAPEQFFDLAEAVESLRREPNRTGGHRQKALYRRGSTTMAVFAFDAGAELSDHVTDGLVLIQGLDGVLLVRTAETEQGYELTPGKVVSLAPGVRHSVTALQEGAMLLTVSLQEKE